METVRSRFARRRSLHPAPTSSRISGPVYLSIAAFYAQRFSNITGAMFYCRPEIVRRSRRFVLHAVGGITKQLNGSAVPFPRDPR